MQPNTEVPTAPCLLGTTVYLILMLETNMKKNESRPFFRLLSGIIAILNWFVSLTTGWQLICCGSSEYVNWQLFGSSFLGAIAFTYVAVVDYMPKVLLHLFSRGPVADDKDLK